jgi:hypothetical protein
VEKSTANKKLLIARPIFAHVYVVNSRTFTTSNTLVERQSRLVSLVYQVLGTLDLPSLGASEAEVLVALAHAFHHKAQITAKAERGQATRQARAVRGPRVFSSRLLKPASTSAFRTLQHQTFL